mmetsp:Transcript_1962/g.5178  ORF Transcript_1962/g.5178 Transcript_1962/m.5178 type:complete len:189 (+) Transcript_1962:127-693(+)
MARKAGKHVPLVCFGHLHRRLIGGGLREMVRFDQAAGTLYLNAAEVPRWRGAGVEPLEYDAADAAAEAAEAAEAAKEAVLGGEIVAEAKAGRGEVEAQEGPRSKQRWFAIVEMLESAGKAPVVDTVRGCWLETDGTVAAEEVWYHRASHIEPPRAAPAPTQSRRQAGPPKSGGGREVRYNPLWPGAGR